MGRSEVTRQSGLSCARRWNKWWFWNIRSSTTLPHEVHSVIERPVVVVAQRPCAAEQYGHFILGPAVSLRSLDHLCCDFFSEKTSEPPKQRVLMS